MFFVEHDEGGSGDVMADGTAKSIADVVVGDEVLSSDPKTGEVSTQLVTALPRTGEENNKVDREMVDQGWIFWWRGYLYRNRKIVTWFD
ncbi:hypothetical protein [Stackebrandtia soli]|uniref:hypothetical protein n=1 Tax=Stackebrandtia soli TaxID=1892856 RepID=UPI0039ED653C